MLQVKDIRQYFRDALARGEFVTDKTGVKTLELIGASFIANEPAKSTGIMLAARSHGMTRCL